MVILAGPAVNLVVAFVIIWALFLSNGQSVATKQVAVVQRSTPAAVVLRTRRSDSCRSTASPARPTRFATSSATHRCAGRAGQRLPGRDAGEARRPARSGQLLTFEVTSAVQRQLTRPLESGSGSTRARQSVGPLHAASLTVTGMWSVTTQTVSVIARIFEPQARKQLSGVVGGYTVTQESFSHSTTRALEVLALISLSLAIINLFPFLPLDGGHVFWAVAEKVRGKRIPFDVMERAGVVGFVLILLLFVIGLSNDISTLTGKGFNVH